MKKIDDIYCYICIFLFLVILSFCLIGEEKKPQDVNITNKTINISQKELPYVPSK